jgi:hypothetical protein
MQEIDKTSIRLSDDQTEIAFLWDGFDGDDCFDSFTISVREADQSAMYDFGACSVAPVRFLTRLVESEGDGTEDGGFRNPDIIIYELTKRASSYELTVYCEAQGLDAKHTVKDSQVEVDRGFLKQQYGDA